LLRGGRFEEQTLPGLKSSQKNIWEIFFSVIHMNKDNRDEGQEAGLLTFVLSVPYTGRGGRRRRRRRRRREKLEIIPHLL